MQTGLSPPSRSMTADRVSCSPPATSSTLLSDEEVAGGLQLTLAAVIEREGGDKPVCIAEPVYRYYAG